MVIKYDATVVETTSVPQENDVTVLWNEMCTGGVNLISIDLLIMVLESVSCVELDIKPYIYSISINIYYKGNVPVAILTIDDFNANEVNSNTFTFLDASLVQWAMEDADCDGDIDMILHFKTQKLDFSLVVDEGDEYPYSSLIGETFGSEVFVGKYAVRFIYENSYSIIDLIIQYFSNLGQLLQIFLNF